MARPREFDKQQLLQSAMQLFWQRGYLDVSMDDLVTHTGVSRYGIYSEFGNKHGLFLAALSRYSDTIIAARLGPLEAPEAGAEQLRHFWRSFIEMADEGQLRWGCLMCNTATELGPLDAEAEAAASDYVDRAAAAFENALVNAVARGELVDPPDVPADYAQFLSVLLLGISAAARIERGFMAAKPTILQVLKQLD